MPWTFAHPAAVLPLRKLGSIRMPLLGLIVGSVAPDLGYYAGRFDVARFAHSGLGVLLFCVPVSVALSWALIRWRLALTAPLPPVHRNALRSLAPPETASPLGAALLVAAVLAGAVTHVVWDSFTHASGEAVRSIAVLRAPLGVYGGRAVYLYNVLQHASTVVGVLVLAFEYRRWLRTKQRTAKAETSMEGFLPVVAISVAAVFLGVCGALWLSPPAGSISQEVVRVVLYSTTAFAGLYLTAAAIMVRAR